MNFVFETSVHHICNSFTRLFKWLILCVSENTDNMFPLIDVYAGNAC